MIKTQRLTDNLHRLPLPEKDQNLFSSSQWLSVLYQTYKLRLFVKYIEENGLIKSYIIYSVVHNFLEDKICICSYCDYCDCYISDPKHWQVFFDALREEYPTYRIAIRNLRDETARQTPLFQTLSKEWFHVLDLRDDLQTLWKKTHDSFRSAVKQAQKNGVCIRRCDKAGLQKFYQLHLRLRKNKYRLFPQPYKFFDIIWEEYIKKDCGVLFGAFNKQGQMVGATMFLCCGNTLYYKFNTSDLNHLMARPNNILLWEGVKFAKEKGLDYLDLGSSGYDQKGLVLFKDHIGAKKLAITHLGFTPPDYKFSHKIILKTMTRLFTSPWMPDVMLRLGSRIIYPYLA